MEAIYPYILLLLAHDPQTGNMRFLDGPLLYSSLSWCEDDADRLARQAKAKQGERVIAKCVSAKQLEAITR